MRTECDEWTAPSREVEHVTPFGTGRFAMLQAIVAIGYHDEIEPWLIGQAAWLAWGKKKGSGFSPGTTTDEITRRKNFASCASKARHKWNLSALTEQLVRFREDGGKPNSVSWQQMIERCDHLIIHGSAGESLRAIELKVKLTGKGDDSGRLVGEALKRLVAEVGQERIRHGLAELGFDPLIHKYPDLFEVEDLEQKTEEGNEQSRPAARRAGDDSRNFNSGGSRRVGGDAARKMDQGSGNAGGADTSQRSVGSGDIEGRLSELDQGHDRPQRLEARL